MCAQFTIKRSVKELEEEFQAASFKGVPKEFDELIVPHTLAPVIVAAAGGKNLVKLMSFSLVPSWSKDRKPKFATHNARLDTVIEKPTWKKPFQTKHVIVPISSFIEPIYVNDLAGNMVQFFDKGEHILAAAGIYDEWVNKETGEVLESFTILTDDPPSFVNKVGHDRCPVFIGKKYFEEWLNPAKVAPEQLLKRLRSNVQKIEFDVAKHRPMRPGWEKRIPKD